MKRKHNRVIFVLVSALLALSLCMSTAVYAEDTGDAGVYSSSALRSSLDESVTALDAEDIVIEPLAAGTDIHRLYNQYLPANVSHHYTGDLDEIAALTAEKLPDGRPTWVDEGVKFKAATSGTPVYRLYNPGDGRHLITKDVNEKDTLSTPAWGWNDEGISFYEPSDTSQKKPIYRLYQPKVMEHLWTSDRNEVSVLTTYHGWDFEDIKFYSDDPADVTVVACNFNNTKSVGGNYYWDAYFKNNSDKTLSSVTASFPVYVNDVQVGEARGQANNVGPGPFYIELSVSYNGAGQLIEDDYIYWEWEY